MNTSGYHASVLRYVFLAFLFVNTLTPRFIGIDLHELPFLGAGRFLLLAFLVFFIWIAAHQHRPLLRRLRPESRLHVALLTCLAVYIVVAIISALFSSEFLHSAKRVLSESFLIGVFIYFSWLVLCADSNAASGLVSIIIACTAIAVIFGLLDYIFGNSLFALIAGVPVHDEMYCGSVMPKLRAGNLRIQSLFDNSLAYGSFLLAALPICASRFDRHGVTPIFPVTLVAMILTSSALTYSRFVWLGTFLCLAGLFVFGCPYRRKIYVLGLVLAAVLTPSVVALQRCVESSDVVDKSAEIDRCKQILTDAGISVLDGNAEGDDGGYSTKGGLAGIGEDILLARDHHTSRSFDYRLSILRAGIDAAVENPLIGVGPGNFSTHVEGEYFSQSIRFRHHENYLVTLLAEIGFIGFIGFSGFVVITLFVAARSLALSAVRSREETHGFFLALLMLCVSFFFLDTMSFNQLSVLFWVASASVLCSVNCGQHE